MSWDINTKVGTDVVVTGCAKKIRSKGYSSRSHSYEKGPSYALCGQYAATAVARLCVKCAAAAGMDCMSIWLHRFLLKVCNEFLLLISASLSNYSAPLDMTKVPVSLGRMIPLLVRATTTRRKQKFFSTVPTRSQWHAASWRPTSTNCGKKTDDWPNDFRSWRSRATLRSVTCRPGLTTNCTRHPAKKLKVSWLGLTRTRDGGKI